MMERTISALPDIIADMSGHEREVWDRIYAISRGDGELILPEALRRQGEKYTPFIRQKIIRVTNRFTNESTLFNELRSRRPLNTEVNKEISFQELPVDRNCPFCNPLEQTPSDLFGRVEGRYCLTASNLAKYDALHALIIFREHDPFVTSEEPIRDFLEVARTWCMRAHQQNPRARYPFFLWNCLWRAGASVVHGHAQVLLAVEPYRSVREWLYLREAYQERFGSPYEKDLFDLYQILGLGRSYREGEILAYLTPVKEKEVVILSPAVEHLPPLISRVLSIYRRMGVHSFNLAILQPPLGVLGPVMARLVDRGDLLVRSSDIGGMELYGGTAVVSGDPFRLADALAEGVS
jgi:hypothetical protein